VTWSDHPIADAGAQPVPAGEPSLDDSADPVVARIRHTVRAIEDIADRPLAEHADAYAAVHNQLQGELAEIDGGTSSG
jgi:hypothetical protein